MAAAYFFDSSALAKCYLLETGTAWVRGLAAPAAGNDLHALRITQAEVTSAVVRRRKAGTLPPGVAAGILAQLRSDFANEYLLLDVSDRLLAAAVALIEARELRAYDGVQLAAAVELNRVRTAAGLPEATFVSADQELNAAATAEGLAVDDPNGHP